MTAVASAAGSEIESVASERARRRPTLVKNRKQAERMALGVEQYPHILPGLMVGRPGALF